MLTTYLIGSLALIVKPGPDLMCTLATALSDGKARAATLMAGLILGCWLWILLLSAGIAPFFVHHPSLMAVVQTVGVVYIAYLSFCAFKEAIHGLRTRTADALQPATARGLRLVGRGVAMAMSNPLTIFFFLAFLPNFTHADSGLSPALQTLLLGTLFCALVPFVYLPVILAADFFRARLVGSTAATTTLKFISALLLAAVALVLAVSNPPICA